MRKPTFVGASIVAFCLSASMFSMFLYLTLYMQNIARLLAASGRPALPADHPAVVLRCAALSGSLTERVPVRLLLGGGLGLVGVGPAAHDAGCSPARRGRTLLPGFLLAGAGIGLTNPAIASAAVGVVRPAADRHGLGHQQHVPAGRASRRASPALGAIFQSSVTGRVADALAASGRAPAGVRLPRAEILVQGDPRVVGPLRQAFLTGYTGALDEILVIAALVALVGAVAALVLVRREDFVAHGH